MSNSYRIHGDNIVECETALKIILESIKDTHNINYNLEYLPSASVTPIIKADFDSGISLRFQFFPGHNRWNVSLPEYIKRRGASLRESVDAFVTKHDSGFEEPVVAFEFCNALPAGNNAWQRMGRALSMVEAEIPYFYFAEIGGQELSTEREIKAPRFPNPVVPFAYMNMSSSARVKTSTVYSPSKSISEDTYNKFKDAFDTKDYKQAISSLFTLSNTKSGQLAESHKKSSKFILDLVDSRKRNNTHKVATWEKMLDQSFKAEPISDYIIKDGLKWAKKISIPTSKTLTQLTELLITEGAVAVGSTDMPICVFDSNKRGIIASKVKAIYGETISEEFCKWLEDGERNIVFVFIAGFKPRGDDSRPDRGLTPLARMAFANDDIDIISVVYGPARPSTWQSLFSNPAQLANTNGLWESIINLSSSIIIDSQTFQSATRRDLMLDTVKYADNGNKVLMEEFSTTPNTYGEHDVDTVLHLIFSGNVDKGIFESLCNPPGGDWSGISLLDAENGTYRWTSLPRVSGVEGKRPDHIIQFFEKTKIVLSIESKDFARNLETRVGPRLTHYTKKLIVESSAQSIQLRDSLEWTQQVDPKLLIDLVGQYSFLSGGAFIASSEEEVISTFSRSEADIVFGFSFKADSKVEIIIKTSNQSLETLTKSLLTQIQDKLNALNIIYKFI